MNKKNIITFLIAFVIIGGIYWYSVSTRTETSVVSEDTTAAPVTSTVSNTQETGRIYGGPVPPNPQQSEGKLKVANFSGKLEQVNEGCYVDGECYVVVNEKHITVVMGWSQEMVGSVLGVESFGDLKSHIGDTVDVYAKDKGDGTYTLYGSEGFYVKVR